MAEHVTTATDVGKLLGVSPNMIGGIGTADHLKTAEYGIEVMGKSPYSNKEVSGFRCFENVIPMFKEILQHVHTM